MSESTPTFLIHLLIISFGSPDIDGPSNVTSQLPVLTLVSNQMAAHPFSYHMALILDLKGVHCCCCGGYFREGAVAQRF